MRRIYTGVVLGLLVGFAGTAFIFWDIDPSAYGLIGRLLALSVMILCAGVGAAIADSTEGDES